MWHFFCIEDGKYGILYHNLKNITAPRPFQRKYSKIGEQACAFLCNGGPLPEGGDVPPLMPQPPQLLRIHSRYQLRAQAAEHLPGGCAGVVLLERRLQREPYGGLRCVGGRTVGQRLLFPWVRTPETALLCAEVRSRFLGALGKEGALLAMATACPAQDAWKGSSDQIWEGYPLQSCWGRKSIQNYQALFHARVS